MTDSSTILAIETATPIGSVALLYNGQIAEQSFGKPHKQAAQLVPMVEQLLAEAGIAYADLGGLAITVGPGSFTGIRIGLAVARTIALSFPALTLYPFTTLECLASGYVIRGKAVTATLNAGKGELYVQSFAADGTASEHKLVAPDTLLAGIEQYIVGNSETLLPDKLKGRLAAPDLPSAAAMLEAIQAGFVPQEREMTPLYIRKPDAEISTKPLL